MDIGSVLAVVLLDIAEALVEFPGGFLERAFGVDIQLAGNVYQGEQHVAQFFLYRGGILGSQGGLKLVLFLPQLVQHGFDGGPVETHRGGLFLAALSLNEGGQGAGDAFQNADPVGLFRFLDALPVEFDGFGITHIGVAKHMGMAADQLGGNPGEDFADVELIFFLGDPGLKHDVQQQVAQFFAERLGIVVLNGFHRLIQFFDKVWHQALGGLFSVPGAAGNGIPQSGEDIHQFLKFFHKPTSGASCRGRVCRVAFTAAK